MDEGYDSSSSSSEDLMEGLSDVRAAAVRTRAVLVKNALNDEELASIHALYSSIRSSDREMSPAEETFQHANLVGLRELEQHVTAFFHINKLIDSELPEMLPKIVSIMEEASKKWGLLGAGGWAERPTGANDHGANQYNVRVCEYHEYNIGGEVCDPKHFDGGSLVSMSVLLNDPNEFEGGEFTTLEADGEERHYQLKRGDAVVFPSEKWHSVQMVKSGTRRTMVTELWSGRRCTLARDH